MGWEGHFEELYSLFQTVLWLRVANKLSQMRHLCGDSVQILTGEGWTDSLQSARSIWNGKALQKIVPSGIQWTGNSFVHEGQGDDWGEGHDQAHRY